MKMTEDFLKKVFSALEKEEIVVSHKGEIFGEELFVSAVLYSYFQTCPYSEYLRSEVWKKKREFELSCNNRCCICNSSKNLDVHHRTYENRGNEDWNDLIVLCRSCHSLFHAHGKLAKEE